MQTNEAAKSITISPPVGAPTSKSIKDHRISFPSFSQSSVFMAGPQIGKNPNVHLDGTHFLQCYLGGKHPQTFDFSLCPLIGTIEPLLEGKAASDGHEMKVDFWEVIQLKVKLPLRVPSTRKLLCLTKKHLIHRGEVMSKIMHMRSFITRASGSINLNVDMLRLLCLVQTQCWRYFYSLSHRLLWTAYLTQSSQLYLETVIHAFGWCLSFRAENSPH